jgi:hypothetical protein
MTIAQLMENIFGKIGVATRHAGRWNALRAT